MCTCHVHTNLQHACQYTLISSMPGGKLKLECTLYTLAFSEHFPRPRLRPRTQREIRFSVHSLSSPPAAAPVLSCSLPSSGSAWRPMAATPSSAAEPRNWSTSPPWPLAPAEPPPVGRDRLGRLTPPPPSSTPRGSHRRRGASWRVRQELACGLRRYGQITARLLLPVSRPTPPCPPCRSRGRRLLRPSARPARIYPSPPLSRQPAAAPAPPPRRAPPPSSPGPSRPRPCQDPIAVRAGLPVSLSRSKIPVHWPARPALSAAGFGGGGHGRGRDGAWLDPPRPSCPAGSVTEIDLCRARDISQVVSRCVLGRPGRSSATPCRGRSCRKMENSNQFYVWRGFISRCGTSL